AAAAVGRNGDVAVGHDEYRVARGDDEVAGQGERKTRTRAGAFDGRDDGLGEGANGLDPAVQAFDGLVLHLGRELPVAQQALQVASGAEVLAFAHDHHAAHVVAALGDVERL